MRVVLLGLVGCGAVAVGWAAADSPSKPLSEPAKAATPAADGLPPPAATDVELVERALAARKEYEDSLKALYEHYSKAGDKQRTRSGPSSELMAYHLMWKPSYNLDVQDVPPPSLEAKVNVKEANDLYRSAMEYKGKGFGDEYMLNHAAGRAAVPRDAGEVPELGQDRRTWRTSSATSTRAARTSSTTGPRSTSSGRSSGSKGRRTDARLRAAVLYDKQLNERTKAVELYRAVIEHDTDADRIKQAEKRLGELTGRK